MRKISLSRLLKALRCKVRRYACYGKSATLSKFWFYGLRPDPFRTIWIDPELLVRPSYKPVPKKKYRVTSVVGGNWDQQTRDFKQNDLFVSMQLHFVDGLRWEDTPYYRMAVANITSGIPFWHQSKTIAELEARCTAIDELFDNIRRNGFLPPTGVEEITTGVASSCVPDGVKVAFGRTGTPLHITGRHRLSIALILNLKTIPVQVAVRHSEWERFRSHSRRAARRRVGSESVNHPDLEYLLP